MVEKKESENLMNGDNQKNLLMDQNLDKNQTNEKHFAIDTQMKDIDSFAQVS